MSVETVSRTRPLTALIPATPPITVRRAEAADVAALHHLWMEPHIVANTGFMPYMRKEEVERAVVSPDRGAYLFVASDGDAIAGSLVLKTFDSPMRRHVAEIGRVGVSRSWQGHGVASALLRAAVEFAERWLNISRTELMVRADNPRAIRLYERFGFVIEGRLNRYGYHDGGYVDIICMARMRE